MCCYGFRAARSAPYLPIAAAPSPRAVSCAARSGSLQTSPGLLPRYPDPEKRAIMHKSSRPDFQVRFGSSMDFSDNVARLNSTRGSSRNPVPDAGIMRIHVLVSLALPTRPPISSGCAWSGIRSMAGETVT
jgi:hypothetical protein